MWRKFFEAVGVLCLAILLTVGVWAFGTVMGVW